MQTIAFCECDPFCQAVLARHWPTIKIYDDIRTLTYERLSSDGLLPIDLICGGFPCQDISIAGRHAGITGKKSSLWKELCRLISVVRPRYALVENVANLLSGDHGQWMGAVLGDLAKIGFDAEWHCIPAAVIGAPHHRDRVWIMAYPHGSRQQGAFRPIMGANDLIRSDWWQTEPYLCRMADGLPQQSHRLRALGNAVVPQLVHLLGRAIIKTDREVLQCEEKPYE